ncbi:MAG: aminopeptidase P family protein [Dehalococcoidales bacterium]|nr:aminopeptidase P family protein [Dehalococcoidales bacterium]MDD4230624.1 aminopeptidase P family protein [Dehalococcoidales bacterium]MDD4465565.1 aminopeptidase P family protein [Dehalococcoidales bacterium]MDD5401809.1 aminopeptidase P family protein [Dehalococcoidales bacterium]
MPNNRSGKLLDKLDQSNLDGFLVSSPHNRKYFSGFSGSSGLLLISRQALILSTDFRYWEQAQNEAPGYTLYRASKGLKEWFAEFIGQANVARLGFESTDITVECLNTMRKSLKKAGVATRLVSTRNLCDKLRMAKDETEIAMIKKAASISDLAAEHARSIVRAGMSEIELAWEVEKIMRQNGSEPVGFSVICASGPNSALPHAKPTQRLINSGEPIVLDFGACSGGYTSDLTRTICCGEPDSQFKKLYNIVLSAQQAAIEGIYTGIKASAADKLARQVIEDAGYGDYFGHSLGHGIGLEVHEAPFLGPTSDDKLEEGMVFTIEPGIYLPGWGGIRIEDDALLQNNKVTLLSMATK